MPHIAPTIGIERVGGADMAPIIDRPRVGMGVDSTFSPLIDQIEFIFLA
jgi:hypothetical protein